MTDSPEYKDLKNSMMVLEKSVKILPEKDTTVKTIPSIFHKAYDENFLSDFWHIS